jgi:hypothetical protein
MGDSNSSNGIPITIEEAADLLNSGKESAMEVTQ